MITEQEKPTAAPLKTGDRQGRLRDQSRESLAQLDSLAAGDLFPKTGCGERLATLIDVADLTVSPIFSVPPSGFSCSVIMRNSVVLPAPLGPMTPTIPPRGKVKSRPSIRTFSP